jgi:hypothetical protein
MARQATSLKACFRPSGWAHWPPPRGTGRVLQRQLSACMPQAATITAGVSAQAVQQAGLR